MREKIIKKRVRENRYHNELISDLSKKYSISADDQITKVTAVPTPFRCVFWTVLVDGIDS
jgi:hypothetical protein